MAFWATQAPHHDMKTRHVEGAAHRDTDPGGFSISRARFSILLSASFGSATVSKTVCRGFDSLRRCVTLPHSWGGVLIDMCIVEQTFPTR